MKLYKSKIKIILSLVILSISGCNINVNESQLTKKQVLAGAKYYEYTDLISFVQTEVQINYKSYSNNPFFHENSDDYSFYLQNECTQGDFFKDNARRLEFAKQIKTIEKFFRRREIHRIEINSTLESYLINIQAQNFYKEYISQYSFRLKKEETDIFKNIEDIKSHIKRFFKGGIYNILMRTEPLYIRKQESHIKITKDKTLDNTLYIEMLQRNIFDLTTKGDGRILMLLTIYIVKKWFDKIKFFSLEYDYLHTDINGYVPYYQKYGFTDRSVNAKSSLLLLDLNKITIKKTTNGDVDITVDYTKEKE